MDTTRTARVMRTRLAAITTVLGCLLTFTACSGGGLTGKYYSDEGQLVIDGSSMTYYDFGCDNGKAVIDTEPSAQGVISDDETEVILASDDEHINNQSVGGTVPFSSTSAGDIKVVKIDGQEFRTADEKAAVNSYENMC